ncbi:MAG: RedB protein, partial [Thermoanaerobaculia bacterium]
LARGPGRSTLLMFAHPHCPCTRASVAELARLMPRLGDRLTAYVLVVQPPGTDDEWAATGLGERAAGIPGVTTLADRGGAEAARFGATTSGITLLYDADGRLLFSGGLTSARGHEGPSFGQRRIAALLTTGAADRQHAPVFGCSLRTPPVARPARAHQGGMDHEGS